MPPGLGQRLGAQAIASAVLFVLASALIWIGVAFGGYALFLAFLPRAGAPWAAALAGALLLIGPVGWAAIMNIRRSREVVRTHAGAQDATLDLLARVAQEKPLLALVFAGILGASEAVLHRKNDL
jgi:hypothetical protein